MKYVREDGSTMVPTPLRRQVTKLGLECLTSWAWRDLDGQSDCWGTSAWAGASSALLVKGCSLLGHGQESGGLLKCPKEALGKLRKVEGHLMSRDGL